MDRATVIEEKINGLSIEIHQVHGTYHLVIQRLDESCICFVCYDMSVDDPVQLLKTYAKEYIFTTLPFGRAVPYKGNFLLRSEVIASGIYSLARHSKFSKIYDDTEWFQILHVRIADNRCQFEKVENGYSHKLTRVLAHHEIDRLMVQNQVLDFGSFVTTAVENEIGCRLGLVTLGCADRYDFEVMVRFTTLQDSSNIILDEIFNHILQPFNREDLLTLDTIKIGYIHYSVESNTRTIEGFPRKLLEKVNRLVSPTTEIIELKLTKVKS
jgi:hypothetical protein